MTTYKEYTINLIWGPKSVGGSGKVKTINAEFPTTYTREDIEAEIKEVMEVDDAIIQIG